LVNFLKSSTIKDKIQDISSLEEMKAKIESIYEESKEKNISVIIPLGAKGMGTSLIGENSMKAYMKSTLYTVVSFD
jgi:hypothetical protein